MFPNSYTPLHRASPPTEALFGCLPSRWQGWDAGTMGLICSSVPDPEFPGTLLAARDATLSESPPLGAYSVVGKVGRMCASSEVARRPGHD